MKPLRSIRSGFMMVNCMEITHLVEGLTENPPNILRLEDSQLHAQRLIMLAIRSGERKIVYKSRCGNEGVHCIKPAFQGVLFHKAPGSLANDFREGKRSDIQVYEQGFDLCQLPFIAGALHQLQPCRLGNLPLLNRRNKTDGIGVLPHEPYQHIRVEYHFPSPPAASNNFPRRRLRFSRTHAVGSFISSRSAHMPTAG